MANSIQVRTVRFLPGQELKSALEEFAKLHEMKAAFIMTCVGSLRRVTLRYATPSQPTSTFNERVESYEENLEICSLVGTVSPAGSHLHLVAGRVDGSVVAGHLVGGAEVQTTAEVVLGDSLAETYDRQYDPNTHYNELVVTKRR